jgi:diguanylate cyclase (GGDEF)-like protein
VGRHRPGGHFKRVNDTHGHQVGDGVLIHVVSVVQGCLRKSDLLARYGGEEFCLLLPDAGAEAAVSLAERIRVALESAPYRSGGVPVGVTASVGVASLGPADEAMGSLVKRADAALYAAKREGRNRVVAGA